jgi:hypothetical protein
LAKYSFLYINGSKMSFFAGRRTHLIGSKWPTGYDARSSLVILSASFPLMFGPRDCLGKSMGFSIRKAKSVVCSKAFFSFFSIRWLKYMRWCVSGCHSASHFRSQEGIMGPLQAAEGGQLEMWRIEVLGYPRKRACLGSRLSLRCDL